MYDLLLLPFFRIFLVHLHAYAHTHTPTLAPTRVLSLTHDMLRQSREDALETAMRLLEEHRNGHTRKIMVGKGARSR